MKQKGTKINMYEETKNNISTTAGVIVAVPVGLYLEYLLFVNLGFVWWLILAACVAFPAALAGMVVALPVRALLALVPTKEDDR